MPIRFRCVYCNQLLGISRRKAGNVVRCTNCGGQIIVPDAEPEPAAVGAAERHTTNKEGRADNPNLFEHGDLDALLQPLASEHPKLADDATTRTPSSHEVFSIPSPTILHQPKPAPLVNQNTNSQISIRMVVPIALIMFAIGVGIGYLVGRGVGG